MLSSHPSSMKSSDIGTKTPRRTEERYEGLVTAKARYKSPTHFRDDIIEQLKKKAYRWPQIHGSGGDWTRTRVQKYLAFQVACDLSNNSGMSVQLDQIPRPRTRTDIPLASGSSPVVVGVATPTLAPSSAIASSNTVSLSVDVERLPVNRNIKTTNAPLASGTSDAANKKTSLEYAGHSTTTPTSSAQVPMSSTQAMEDGDEFRAAFNIDDIDGIEGVTVIAKHQPPEKRKAVDLEPSSVSITQVHCRYGCRIHRCICIVDHCQNIFYL